VHSGGSRHTQGSILADSKIPQWESDKFQNAKNNYCIKGELMLWCFSAFKIYFTWHLAGLVRT
jgi:hypothetical protein